MSSLQRWRLWASIALVGDDVIGADGLLLNYLALGRINNY
jgi:hypothetical protein